MGTRIGFDMVTKITRIVCDTVTIGGIDSRDGARARVLLGDRICATSCAAVGTAIERVGAHRAATALQPAGHRKIEARAPPRLTFRHERTTNSISDEFLLARARRDGAPDWAHGILDATECPNQGSRTRRSAGCSRAYMLTAQRLLPDRVKHCVSSSVWPSRLPSRKACLCGTTTLLPRATHGRVPPGRPITRVHRVATMGALAVPAGHRDSIHQDNRRVARHSCVDNCGLVAGHSTGSTACATNERQDKVGL